jgi:hypothetical protein
MISAVPGQSTPKKLHWKTPTILKQSNIYVIRKSFHYVRLGTKFDNWRTLSKLIGTPGTR